jgi:hypothetical protein
MNQEKKSQIANRIFYIILSLLILGSVGVTFWRIVIEKDYQIVAETSCDPVIEACYHYEPEPCATDNYECLSLPPEEAYDYKMVSKKAASIYACEQTEEKTGCNDELSCLEGEADCSYTYCDPAALEEWEACSEPQEEGGIIDPVDEPLNINNLI